MSERNNDRQTHLVMLGLLAVCLWLVYDRQQLRRQLTGHAAPAAALDAAAAPITEKLTKAKAADLAAFYRALGDVIGRDRNVIKSTGVFRVGHGRALELAFAETATAGEPKGGELVDAVFFAALGKIDKPIDDDARAEIVAAAAAVVRACEAVK